MFQRAAVLESEVNALLNAGFLRGNLIARGNFDSLPIPFRAVATDLLSGNPYVFATGDLAQAVRASAAIPLLFEPENVEGRYLGDGGLSANVPIAVARREGAGRMIVSYTTERMPDSLNLQSTLVLIDHLIGNLFRQPSDSLGVRGCPDPPGRRGISKSQFLDLGRHGADCPGLPGCRGRAWKRTMPSPSGPPRPVRHGLFWKSFTVDGATPGTVRASPRLLAADSGKAD